MGCLIYASKMFDAMVSEMVVWLISLGRAGLLQEVYDFIRKMPFEADATRGGIMLITAES
ncbi:hypothetical protein H5410_000172 [Solanum commersonii]|uniref:Pentatricopeptide repeat-containing protein n=1 Tax=Solanum commersonii TaxID=4109 RepID=A0A9J6AWF2_SOLCO|nr:hypothetical protein H5410_000170 [Solanum commersonii]KAG5628455.1 hypothetical protein H5410_000172 [Solanum commersonii]